MLITSPRPGPLTKDENLMDSVWTEMVNVLEKHVPQIRSLS